jgi:hypothetical protein
MSKKGLRRRQRVDDLLYTVGGLAAKRLVGDMGDSKRRIG